MGVKVKKPDMYDGAKGPDLDTWLFSSQGAPELDCYSKKGIRPICGIISTRKQHIVVA